MAIKFNFKKAFHGILCSTIIMGCHFNQSNKKAAEVISTSNVTGNGIDFSQIDSVECVYPKGAKENQQTGSFFIKEPLFINTLKNDLAATQKPAAECTHNVKLYLYKNGEVFKTVYVALPSQCNYLAYAVNSRSYFVPLSFKLHQLLQAHLTPAVSPLK